MKRHGFSFRISLIKQHFVSTGLALSLIAQSAFAEPPASQSIFESISCQDLLISAPDYLMANDTGRLRFQNIISDALKHEATLSKSNGFRKRIIEILEDLKSYPEKWAQWMSAQQSVLSDNPTYFANSAAALTSVFIPWYTGESSLEFKSMLDLMRTYTITGSASASGYSYTPMSHDYVPEQQEFLSRDELFKGSLWVSSGRPDIPNWVTESLVSQFPLDLHLPTKAITDQMRLLDQSDNGHANYGMAGTLTLRKGSREYPVSVTFIYHKSPDHIDSLGVLWPVRLNGFPEERYDSKTYDRNLNSTWRRVDGRGKGGGKVFVPVDSALPPFIQKAGDIISEIRKIPIAAKNKDRLLDLLADYYQILITSHVYMRVNQSFLMNQVNFILRLHGFPAVLHRDIDYWAYLLGWQEFRKYFKDEVRNLH